MKGKSIGLTATPIRKDGHHPIIFMQCGPIRFNMSSRAAVAQSPFRHLVEPRQTSFRMPVEMADYTIQDVYAALTVDDERNQQIIADIREAVRLAIIGRYPPGAKNRLSG